MSGNVVNQVAYLRTTRDFPEDNQAMRIELIKSYIDTSNAVNARVIGLHPTNRPAINGEEWFLTGTKQQGLRQVYPFTATGTIAHGINFASVSFISPKSYGSFTDSTNWYGAIYASNVAIAGQVSFYVDPTNINILAGAGAPSITSGVIVLEWVSQV
jgi:hypothetical protein